MYRMLMNKIRVLSNLVEIKYKKNVNPAMDWHFFMIRYLRNRKFASQKCKKWASRQSICFANWLQVKAIADAKRK